MGLPRRDARSTKAKASIAEFLYKEIIIERAREDLAESGEIDFQCQINYNLRVR